MTNVKDIRQSDNWSEYLSYLGWKSLKTPTDTLAEYRDTPLGKIVKIQRPNNLNCNDVKFLEKNLKQLLLIKVEPKNTIKLNPCGFVEHGTPLLPPSTICVDLKKNERELRKSLSRSARYAVNRAERDQTNIEIHQTPENIVLKEFHNILKETGKANHFYVQPFDDLTKKRDVFGKESFLITAKDANGSLLGGIFYLGNEKTIWSLHVATGKSSSKNKGNYLLVWKAIWYFKSLGYETMDMEGVQDNRFPKFTKRWGGFTEFKRRFGGETVRFPPPQIKIYNPIIKSLTKITKVKI